MSDFNIGLQRMLENNVPRAREVQVEGLQLGTIVEVIGQTASFTLISDPRYLYGPAPFGRGFTPVVGDRALIAFVGNGVDSPWVVASAPST